MPVYSIPESKERCRCPSLYTIIHLLCMITSCALMVSCMASTMWIETYVYTGMWYKVEPFSVKGSNIPRLTLPRFVMIKKGGMVAEWLEHSPLALKAADSSKQLWRNSLHLPNRESVPGSFQSWWKWKSLFRAGESESHEKELSAKSQYLSFG